MLKKILIILFFAASVGARHAVPLQEAFAATQDDGQPCPPECVTDSMEIITYYPSPYGYYEELRGDKIIVGDSDASSIPENGLPPSGTLTFESLSDDPDASDGNIYEGSLYYQGAIGGTLGKFRFYDGSSWQDLGTGAYWDKSSSNSNDIYYTQSGNVGIGTNNPTQMLTVNGTVKLLSGGIQFPDGTIQTTSGIPSGYNWITDFGSALLLKNGVSISAYCRSCTAVGGGECGDFYGYARNNNGVI